MVGYEKSTDFKCIFKDLLTATYDEYPECQLASCGDLPNEGQDYKLVNCNETYPLVDGKFRVAHGDSCRYKCKDGYGTKMDGSVMPRGVAEYDGDFKCQQGNFVLDHPGSCVLLECNTGGQAENWECFTDAAM